MSEPMELIRYETQRVATGTWVTNYFRCGCITDQILMDDGFIWMNPGEYCHRHDGTDIAAV